MNFSKLATFVVFLAGSSQVAYGIELAPNLSLNTEVEVEHKLDAESTTMILEPELGYVLGIGEFTVGTTLNVWDNTNRFTLGDQFDHIPTMDFGYSYMLQDNLELEAGTSYNFEDEERGEITLKASFSF
jgi:hypothetical protein